jgi:aminoglycoside phosphotransferase (APT) family kinase protein
MLSSDYINLNGNQLKLRINKNMRTMKKLETYLRLGSQKNFLINEVIPTNSKGIRISDFEKIGGGIRSHVYSFHITYEHAGFNKSDNLVLKTYRDTSHPIFKRKFHDASTNCLKEFQAMKSLWGFDFNVPRVYFCECDSGFLGSPFLIMNREIAVQSDLDVNCFAKTLATLHNLKPADLGIQSLRAPKDENAFAKYWLIHLINLLYMSNHSKKLEPVFDSAINWLKSNVSSCICPQYRLVHGDYHPGNTILTKTGLSVIDWEGVEIGDPAFDVAYAYHMIKFFSSESDLHLKEKTADLFVSEYIKNIDDDILPRLKFYKIITVFRVAMYAYSSMSNPIAAYKRYGTRALLKYPLIYLPFASKKINKQFDFPWISYFQDFINSFLHS